MQTQVLIIGAGVTGTGLARDLALRGVSCIVVDKKDVNAGASGGNHGLLHSGARYIATDPASARECQIENQVLKSLAPHCIEETGGIFAAVVGDDENYIADFAAACGRCDIPVSALGIKEAREMEPALSDKLIAAFAVNDATIDPFKLALDNMAYAQGRGSRLLPFTRVTGFELDSGGGICRSRIRDELTGRDSHIEADVVVNAAGAWAGIIAGFASAAVELRYSKGTLLVTQNRISQRVVNRLRRATDGDILAPGGTVSILGTTSQRVDSPDEIYPEVNEVDAIISEGAAMMPELAETRYIRAYCGVRPLIGENGKSAGEGDDRSVSRGYELIDHSLEANPIGNFITITGGKLTTYRLMAEKTADLVCRRLGLNTTCSTRSKPLPNTVAARWTEPGLAPNHWLRKKKANDMMLCECEMVSQSVVAEIVAAIQKQGARPTLESIGLRSRIGKGPCQGTFCSQQLSAYLYDNHYIDNHKGPADLRSFLQERWRGQQPLLWNHSLAQAELLEAMHCGLFSIDLAADDNETPA